MISIKHPDTPGAVYVGRSGNALNRFKEHKRGLKSGNHHCKELQYMFDLVGRDEDILVFQILEQKIKDKDADKVEAKWIHTAINELGKDRVLNSFIPNKPDKLAAPKTEYRNNKTPKQLPSAAVDAANLWKAAQNQDRIDTHRVVALVRNGGSKTKAIREVCGITGGEKFARLSKLADALQLLQRATSN